MHRKLQELIGAAAVFPVLRKLKLLSFFLALLVRAVVPVVWGSKLDLCSCGAVFRDKVRDKCVFIYPLL